MKKITCPEHPSHQAILYEYPEHYAGVWECEFEGESYSDTCEHDPEKYEIEDITTDYHDPGNDYGHGQRQEQIYVCGECGCAIDPDIADPAEDAYEAETNAQIEESRDED